MLPALLCTLCLTIAEPPSLVDKIKRDYDMEWTISYGDHSYIHIDLSDRNFFEITFTKHF